MRSLGLLFLLGCSSACSSPEGARQVTQDCRKYQMPITVGGVPEQADLLACLQPDGSTWRIIQTTPGLPTQVYTVPIHVADPRTSQ
jgi:hypothetical protein